MKHSNRGERYQWSPCVSRLSHLLSFAYEEAALEEEEILPFLFGVGNCSCGELLGQVRDPLNDSHGHVAEVVQARRPRSQTLEEEPVTVL